MKRILAFVLSIAWLTLSGITSATSLPNVRMKSDGLTLLYGNSFIERMQEDGTFEALLHAAHWSLD